MKGYWNNLRPFEKRVVVGVAAMVFVVFNIWFVRPHFSDWGRVQNRMAAARKKLKLYQSEVGQISTVSNQVIRLESDGLSVPPEEQSVQFLRAIQMQAGKSSVNILSSGRQIERTNQFFLELSQTFNLQSGEAPLVDFLYNLGSSNSLLRVRDMTLHPDAPRQTLNAGVLLVASYQKKAPARPAAVPASATTTGKVSTNAVKGPTKSTTPQTRGAPAQTNKMPSSATNKPALPTLPRK